MATRFVATCECDASIKFKEAYVKCRNEDIIIIDSPVGLPGRAIQNKFLDEITQHFFTINAEPVQRVDRDHDWQNNGQAFEENFPEPVHVASPRWCQL